MTEINKTQKGGGVINIGMVIAIIVLAIVTVILLVVVVDLATTDESEGDGPPITGVPTPLPGTPSVTALTDVNVRAGPGTQYDVYGVIAQGQIAIVVGVCTDFSWWAISIPVDPGTGWVSADYVNPADTGSVSQLDCSQAQQPVVPTPAPGEPSVTATALLNVRTGPGTQFDSYGMLRQNQAARAVGINADASWFAIDLPPAPDGIGWVSAEFVVAENTSGLPVMTE